MSASTIMEAANVPPAPIHYKFPIHGVLMAIAFGFLLPLGIIFARFFRSPHYSPLWFRLHQVLMLLGFALIIAAFAIGVVRANDNDFSHSEYTFHRRAGFYVFGAVCLQVMMGLVRPAASAPGSGQKLSVQRTVWNEAHRWNGRVAYAFGIAQIYTGIHVLDRHMTLWIVLFSALWGSLILIAILLQLMVCVKGSAFGDDGTYTRTTLTGNTTAIVKPQPAQPRTDVSQMQSVKVVDDRAVEAAVVEVAAVLTTVPVVQGASITRPLEGSSPELSATLPTAAPLAAMTLVHIA